MILELYLELSYFFSQIFLVVTVTEVTEVPKFLIWKQLEQELSSFSKVTSPSLPWILLSRDVTLDDWGDLAERYSGPNGRSRKSTFTILAGVVS